MDDFLEIPKDDGSGNYPSWADTFTTVEGVRERVRPHIRCNCGKYTNIMNHHVHPDGRITESYFHNQYGGCGWHVYLKMIGWQGGEFKPGQYRQSDEPGIY